MQALRSVLDKNR